MTVFRIIGVLVGSVLFSPVFSGEKTLPRVFEDDFEKGAERLAADRRGRLENRQNRQRFILQPISAEQVQDATSQSVQHFTDQGRQSHRLRARSQGAIDRQR